MAMHDWKTINAMSFGKLGNPASMKTASFWHFANPARFAGIVNRVVLPLGVLTTLLLAVGLVWGLLFAPPDYLQGSAVKIIFVHVPSALMAINCWIMMLIASIIWVVRRHRTSILAARAAAPVGMAMAVIALITGAVWGEPIWGTFWAWEPRLTSFLILFLHYLVYMLLWKVLDGRDSAADLTAILCVVGSLFALLSRYAVFFWQDGLHQPPSLSLDPETNIHNAYYIPLLITMVGFGLLCITLILIRTRTDIIDHLGGVRRVRS